METTGGRYDRAEPRRLDGAVNRTERPACSTVGQLHEGKESHDLVRLDFLAELSHELRNAAASLQGYAAMLLSATHDTDSAAGQVVRGISANSQYLVELLDSLLDLSRAQAERCPGRSERKTLGAVADAVVACLEPRAFKEGLGIDVALDEDIAGGILAHATCIQRILTNLVANAIKYSTRGRILIRAVREWEGGQAPGGKPWLRFEVADRGPGIDPADLTRLLDPFFQGQHTRQRPGDGWGLGLSITRRLVDFFGGELRATGRPGGGSVFVVRLPAALVEQAGEDRPPWSEAPPAEHGTVACAADGPKASVLIVEDDANLRRIARFYLESAGVSVATAPGCAAALEESPKRFDAILVDLQMPVHDGWATARALRAVGYEGPILAFTAEVTMAERPPDPDGLFSGFLSKADNREELMAGLLPHLGQREGGLSRRGAGGRNDNRRERLVESYVTRLSGLGTQMREALAQGDHPALGKMAHRLAGTGGLYGFPSLSEAAHRLQHALVESHGNDALDYLLEDVEMEIDSAAAVGAGA